MTSRGKASTAVPGERVVAAHWLSKAGGVPLSPLSSSLATCWGPLSGREQLQGGSPPCWRGQEENPPAFTGNVLGVTPRHVWPHQGRERVKNIPSLHWQGATQAALGEGRGIKHRPPPPPIRWELSSQEIHGSGPLGSVLGLGCECGPFSALSTAS